MADPINIFTRQVVADDVGDPEGDPEVIAMLEQCLEDAKSGRLTALALAGTTRDHSIMTAWSASIFDEPFVFVGILDAIKARLLNYLTCDGDHE